MRKETVGLAEAVRNLKLTLTGRPAPREVRIGIDAAAFASRLAELQRALEMFDAAGGAMVDTAVVPPGEETERLKSGVDSLIRWIRIQGLDTTEPMRLLEEAVTGKRAKRQQAFEMLPKFSPRMPKKKKWQPKLRLETQVGGTHLASLDMGGHVRIGSDMGQVALKIGDVMPDDSNRRNAKRASEAASLDDESPTVGGMRAGG